MSKSITAFTIELFIHVSGKNREETALQITRAQLKNNLKYSTGFEYSTHWFSEKKATISYYIDIKHAKANFPTIGDFNGD